MKSVAQGRRLGVAVAAVALLTLAACSSGSTGSSSGTTTAPPAATSDAGSTTSSQDGLYGDQSAPTSAPAAAASGTSLATASTGLGTIVVDGKGMTVYQFDKDTQGAGSSACTGQCATQWPAVPGGAAMPSVDGVTGTVGTITGTDGQPQLTLNGWPLYYYAGDSAAGDTKGQGVGGIWWVLTPAGERVTG
ncbi:MAG TPA: hypothetical protein VGC04_14750 [Cellulomonas sp.]